MRIIKALLGILLLPVLYAVAVSFYREVSALGSNGQVVLILERGVLAYVLFHVLIKRPARLYVWAHETVHVLATWICGGRVESFSASSGSGSVVTSKTNIFIELSPYFIPLYTVLLGPLFILAKMMIGPSAELNTIFLFLIGVTLAFHFVMTVEVLKLQQSDIEKSGPILSFVFILIFNFLVITLVFAPIFEEISLKRFAKETKNATQTAYLDIYDKAKELYELGVSNLKSA